MNDDPIVAEIQSTRARLLAGASGEIATLMTHVRTHERGHPERFVTPVEWREIRTASRRRLPVEWLYTDPVVSDIRVNRAATEVVPRRDG